MQKLSELNSNRLNAWLLADRQWKREHRIAYARRALKFAHAKEDQEDVAFWRAVVKANQ